MREKIGIVHSVIYTHEHSDHLFGFDDLRLFQFYLGGAVPAYCSQKVARRLRTAFAYAFTDDDETHPGATPSVEIHTIDHSPIDILGATIIPIPMLHGPDFEVLGFRVGNVAYCTDVSEIPDSSMTLLQNLDTLVLDALRPEKHVTHLSTSEATEIALQLGVKQTYFTHCSCKVDYEKINPTLPDGIDLGYDGLRIRLT